MAEAVTPKSASQSKPESKHHVLHRILMEAREFQVQKRPFLACFDLDSTLFDLTLRVAMIVDAFAGDALMLSRFPQECEALKKIQIQRSDWGLGEPLSRVGISETSHPEFFRELHEFWARGFFSNHYLDHDEPLPGSVEYVDTLCRWGAEIMYLTGRDVPRMLYGTRRSLLARGLPVNDTNAHLVLKPQSKMDDALFKLDVLREAEKRYERIWLFENEPVNLNLIARECPSIGLVFIDSVHSGREQLAGTLDRIDHFEVDLGEFKAAVLEGENPEPAEQKATRR